MHKIYAELVFLDNFIIDLLIILFAALLTRSKLRMGRFLISAAIGGVYASMAMGFVFLGNAGVKLAVGALMCIIAFRVKGERVFWKNTCAFFVTAFIFAGSVYAVSGLLGKQSTYGIVIRPEARDVILGLGSGTALAGVFCIVRRKAALYQNRVRLTLEYKGKRITVRAFVDTGNMLTEPLSGLDVIVVSRAVANILFGKDADFIFRLRGMGITERLRAVPYATASGEGVMFGLEADSVAIKGSGGGVKAVVCASEAALGYEAIAGAALMDRLTGGKVYDEVSFEQGRGMADGALEGSGADRLYKRQRRSSAAADAAGGNGTAGGAGQRG